MTQFPNVLVFGQLRTEPTADNLQLGGFFSAWLNYVQCGRNRQTADYHVPISGDKAPPAHFRAGKTYYMWIKKGFIKHISGLDKANHYVELPISWLSVVKSSNPIMDENDEVIGQEVITNEDFYKEKLRKNDDYCLVHLTDANFQDFFDNKILFTNDIPDNIIAEDKFLSAIAMGGDYFVTPQTEI